MTRDGKPIRIVCIDSPILHHPIVGFVECDLFTWTDDGKVIYGGKCEDKNDIFFADEEEELNDFESKLYSTFSDIWQDYMLGREIDVVKTMKEYSQELLNLARKEILKEQDRCVIIPEDDYYEQLASQYHKGHEDALKSSPKWKKVDSNPPKVQYNLQGTRLYKDGEYYIELSDLETLPKEE